MNPIEIVLGALLFVFAVLIIVVVLLQEGRSAGLSGAIAGGADTFLGSKRGRSVGEKLQKWTKFIAITFFILTLGVNIALLLIK